MRNEITEYFWQQWIDFNSNPRKNSEARWDETAMHYDQMTCSDIKHILSAVEILKRENIISESADIIDIGCGTGRFAAEFARVAKHVTCTDFSRGMLAVAQEKCHSQGLTNVGFHKFDFKSGNLSETDWNKKYDLAFASMTPAAGTKESLNRMMQVSKKYCCYTACITGKWDPSWMDALYYVLRDMGYLPEIKYYEAGNTEASNSRYAMVIWDVNLMTAQNDSAE